MNRLILKKKFGLLRPAHQCLRAHITTTKKEIVLLEENFHIRKKIYLNVFWVYLMGSFATREHLRDAYIFRKQH